MALKREMLPDRPKAREKFLCAFRVAKAAHLKCQSARTLRLPVHRRSWSPQIKNSSGNAIMCITGIMRSRKL
jgi:hypothetical protein